MPKYQFQPEDRTLFNTGFYDGLAAVQTPNQFWAPPGTEGPVTLEQNIAWLQTGHPDRTFAEACLVGVQEGLARVNGGEDRPPVDLDSASDRAAYTSSVRVRLGP